MSEIAKTEQTDVLGSHVDRAEAWLAGCFGDRLNEGERIALIRVLFDRAWRCKSEMDADAILRAVTHVPGTRS